MAEEPMTIFQETSIPYIDANVFPETSFHNFELVSMIQIALEPMSSWPAVVLMAAKEMLMFGYKLGQGLVAVGWESLDLIELSYNKGRFSLEYKPTDEEIFQALRRKKKKKEVCCFKDVYFPYQDHFSGFGRGHYSITFQGIGIRGARSSLHY